MTTPGARATLIVYACPTGPLHRQVGAFYAASRERFGPNSAHAYPPHITLTGFFEDAASALPIYVGALRAAWDSLLPHRPAAAVTVAELRVSEMFHGLLIDSAWLEALAAAFAAHAASPTRAAPLRLKRDLHLSLAYGFCPEDGPGLGALAQAMVDPAAPAGWELRLYERPPAGDWLIHASLPL